MHGVVRAGGGFGAAVGVPKARSVNRRLRGERRTPHRPEREVLPLGGGRGDHRVHRVASLQALPEHIAGLDAYPQVGLDALSRLAQLQVAFEASGTQRVTRDHGPAQEVVMLEAILVPHGEDQCVVLGKLWNLGPVVPSGLRGVVDSLRPDLGLRLSKNLADAVGVRLATSQNAHVGVPQAARSHDADPERVRSSCLLLHLLLRCHCAWQG
mmetsp:Transcript_40810/g.113464  ORF Transcript_40810/g.113464 Transcript_40810/m.113464 type:complete len:211 (-) Transcript_40810:559-1191(-)